MPMERKILLGILAVVALIAAAWFGRGLLPGESQQPPPPPQAAASPAASTAPAAATAARIANPEALIDQALEATGMNRSVDQIQQQMGAGMDASGAGGGLKPEMRALLRKTMLESFPADSLRQRLRERFKAGFNADHLRALLADISSPAAQRMMALEGKAVEGARDEQSIALFTQQLRETPLPEPRRAMLRRLEAAVGASRQATEITLVTARAIMQGAGKPAGDLEGEMAKMRASLESQMREALLVNLAYVFRDANDEDLAAYTAIYESPHGQWFMDNVYQAMREDFQVNSERFGARLAELVQKQRELAAAPAEEGSAGAGEATRVAAGEAPRGTTRPHLRWRQDARACLNLERDLDVIRCAEKYY